MCTLNNSSKLIFTFLLLFSVSSMYSKQQAIDTIQPLLHGIGCGITPNTEESEYNINLLNKHKALDSNNIYVYKNLAKQYYILYAKEKDSIKKEIYRQLAIANNIKVLALKQFKRNIAIYYINNIILLNLYSGNCEDAKYYYNQLTKKEKKLLEDTGSIKSVRDECNVY